MAKTSATIIARGTSHAAFTQLTGCSVTRSGTTATLTKSSHGLNNGDKVLIQGFSLEEFNGVFTVGNVASGTFDYTIKQDPGANPSGTTGTVDKVTMGTALDLSSSYMAQITGQIQNGNSGPTVAAQIWIGEAQVTTPGEPDYIWRLLLEGSTANNGNTPFSFSTGPATRAVNLLCGRNTGQAVDVMALATHLS